MSPVRIEDVEGRAVTTVKSWLSQAVKISDNPERYVGVRKNWWGRGYRVSYRVYGTPQDAKAFLSGIDDQVLARPGDMLRWSSGGRAVFVRE